MTVVKTSFVVPYPADKTIIAIQDTINHLGWHVLEMTSMVVVARLAPSPMMVPVNLPKLTATLTAAGEETNIHVSVSQVNLGNPGVKTTLTGIMGQFVNSVSLRIQTDSVAINPTVAIGEGQGGPSSASPQDRLAQLERLGELLDKGVLSDEEFRQEKQRILSS
jgi:hypothetical protein